MLMLIVSSGVRLCVSWVLVGLGELLPLRLLLDSLSGFTLSSTLCDMVRREVTLFSPSGNGGPHCALLVRRDHCSLCGCKYCQHLSVHLLQDADGSRRIWIR